MNVHFTITDMTTEICLCHWLHFTFFLVSVEFFEEIDTPPPDESEYTNIHLCINYIE